MVTIDVNNINGWTSGGAMAGRDISEVIGKNEETGVVCFITISGPTEFQSTTYAVKVGHYNTIPDSEIIDRGLDSKEEAELTALKFMRDNPSYDV